MCPIPANIRRKLHKKTDISHTLALPLHLPQYLRRTHCYTAAFSVLTSLHYSSTAPQTTASPCMWTYPLGGDTVHWVQDGLVKMFVTDSVGLPWTRSSLSASSSYLPCALRGYETKSVLTARCPCGGIVFFRFLQQSRPFCFYDILPQWMYTSMV